MKVRMAVAQPGFESPLRIIFLSGNFRCPNPAHDSGKFFPKLKTIPRLAHVLQGFSKRLDAAIFNGERQENKAGRRIRGNDARQGLIEFRTPEQGPPPLANRAVAHPAESRLQQPKPDFPGFLIRDFSELQDPGA